MRTRFRDDDVGKRVVRPNGGEVGVVVAVEADGERARVETDDGLADAVASALGRDDEDVLELSMDDVETVTDDTVRLQRPLD
ncbi:PRC-barrel domain containing protein [Halomarina oriensis]|uniref:PRC-barrel domain containing protein n=1 Tax=Halomarina oriensis TaxID=671145 RepID=A0A6B0GIG2_9EURY|nr:PRC-barrel domain containing protein [Halomarina oriensis]MWG33239.1 PRC-barrel domain containing protein [Halomarina oriensis]